MAYKNTQIGYVTIFLMGMVMVFLGVIIQTAEILPAERPILYAALLLFLFLFIIFSTLTVEVNRSELIWYYGPGIWKYRIPLENIKDITHVKSHPLEGFGIRWNPFKGWLYNVSGFNAINVIHKNGKSTRIGTPEPDKLIDAIRQELSYI